MYSWVRYSVAAYVGLLLAGSMMTGGRQASAGWGSEHLEEGTVEILTPAHPMPPADAPSGHRLHSPTDTHPDQPSR